MKFKKYIKALLVSGACLALTACNDFLDETPKGTIIPETVDDFGMILDDATGLWGNQIAYGSSNTLAMDDDVMIAQERESKLYKQEFKAYCWDEQLYEPTGNDYDYSGFYKVIYFCNHIINNIDKAPEGDGKYRRDEVRANALVHRAFAYLMLVNIYAKPYDAATAATEPGVALILDADPALRLERATVQEVYTQVIADATAALGLLPDMPQYSFRASDAAANALLARTYLYMGDYEKSYGYAEKAVGKVGEPFDFNNLSLYGNNPDNGVDGGWIVSSYDGYACPDVVLYKRSTNSAYYYYNVSDDLLSLFDKDADLRYRIFITPYEWYDDEYLDEFGMRIGGVWDFNFGLGKGEIYLTAAETAARNGNLEAARKYLNALRIKRMDAELYEDVTETDNAALLKTILEERRRELMFTGLRWFDLRRLNREPQFAKTITHDTSRGVLTLEPGSPRYTLQIPQSVIDANPLIKQND